MNFKKSTILSISIGLTIGIVLGGTLSFAQGTIIGHTITAGPFLQHFTLTKGFYGAQAFSKLSPDQKLSALNEKLELLLIMQPSTRDALIDM